MNSAKKTRFRIGHIKGVFQYVIIGAGILAVILSSLALNGKLPTFLTRASEFDQSPTMKHRRLDSGNNDRPDPGENPTVTVKPQPTTPQSAPTGTPKPVPTSSETRPTCRVDGIMKDNCRCPDMQGFKCNGENTTTTIDGQTYQIPNFYWYAESDPRAQTDTVGFYLGVKGSWIYKQSKEDYERLKAAKKPNCTEWCIGKPVIYLYPEEPTSIDVRVEVPGHIYISDPVYPEGGWKDVMAYPDGTLTYQGKQYRDLYYETDLDTDVRPPTTGLLIPKANLKEQLVKYTRQLGLSDFESNEFVEYWVPLLEDLNSPYVLFSVFDQDEKERIDTVYINPKPDTFIAFIAYFKPVYEWYETTPLQLPEVPPARVGYTAVEWGGTIDTAAIRE